MKADIVILPGDGIGPEVVAPAVQALTRIAEFYGHDFSFNERLIGGAAIDATGSALPHTSLQACHDADAILLGAVGGPNWSDPSISVRPEQGLLQLRKELGLYANLRPVKTNPHLADASPLKPDRLENVDLMIVRELTSGIYFGEKSFDSNSASDLCSYTREEISRTIHCAAKLAVQRQGKISLIDKANVLATSRLWRQVTQQLIAECYPELELEILLVDAAAMHLLSRPADFDVIVTENMFGDILTDEASMLAGSLGVLPSASLGESRLGLYEPIHGSAPDIAGSGIANPLATLLSAALLLRHSLKLPYEANILEQAVDQCIADGGRSADLGGSHSTEEIAQMVLSRLKPPDLFDSAYAA